MGMRWEGLSTLLATKYGSKLRARPRAAKLGISGEPTMRTKSGGWPAAIIELRRSGSVSKNLILMPGFCCSNNRICCLDSSLELYMTVNVVTLRSRAASVCSATPGSRSAPAPTAAPAARADCARKRRRLIGVGIRPDPFAYEENKPRHTTTCVPGPSSCSLTSCYIDLSWADYL